MKYSELISFNPIEDVVDLRSANNKEKAINYVKTYVLNDKMADALKANVVDQLQMEEAPEKIVKTTIKNLYQPKIGLIFSSKA